MYFNFNLIIFLDNYIDIPALKNMQVHHVEKLLLLYPLGVTIKFETSLMLWQKTLFVNISMDQNQLDMLFPTLGNNEVKSLLESWDLAFLLQTCISKLLYTYYYLAI